MDKKLLALVVEKPLKLIIVRKSLYTLYIKDRQEHGQRRQF